MVEVLLWALRIHAGTAMQTAEVLTGKRIFMLPADMVIVQVLTPKATHLFHRYFRFR